MKMEISNTLRASGHLTAKQLKEWLKDVPDEFTVDAWDDCIVMMDPRCVDCSVPDGELKSVDILCLEPAQRQTVREGEMRAANDMFWDSMKAIEGAGL